MYYQPAGNGEFKRKVKEGYAKWTGEDFEIEFFITLTADPSQSRHKSVLKKMVKIFVRKLNESLYARRYKRGERDLRLVVVYEKHLPKKKHTGNQPVAISASNNDEFENKDKSMPITYHAHICVSKLKGDERLKKPFETLVKHIWQNEIRHKRGYGICDVRKSYDNSGLYDYINKENSNFDPDHFEYIK